MVSADLWSVIHDERRALAADVEGLTDEQWSTPSLCAGWSVRQVLGHMTATAETMALKFVGSLIASGFRFNAMGEKAIAKQCEGTPADTVARFKAVIDSSRHPPGPATSWLGETVIHSEDIRRPLGITHKYPAEALIRVADFYRGSNLIIGGKKRVAGLTLKATDADWSGGSGPEVGGPMLALVVAIAGRPAALEELSGDGLATLKERMPPPG